MSNTPNDPINHPPHYNQGGVEVVDALEAWSLDQDFYLGNAIKYIARAGKKDPAKLVEDLEKAAWYLRRRIEKLTVPRPTATDAAGACARAMTIQTRLDEERAQARIAELEAELAPLRQFAQYSDDPNAAARLARYDNTEYENTMAFRQMDQIAEKPTKPNHQSTMIEELARNMHMLDTTNPTRVITDAEKRNAAEQMAEMLTIAEKYKQ